MRKLGHTIIAILLMGVSGLKAQCSITSSCGYTVSLSTRMLNIVPSTTNCTSGYNYNIRFTYTINVKGSNTCFNGNIGFQPQFLCASQNNGYFTINAPAPTVGGGSVNANYTGTLTTTTNPFRGVNDCNTATPGSIGCSSFQITVFGPGISSSTFPCNAALLPIELSQFSGQCADNYIELQWRTLSEKNNHFFLVESSSNGTEWTSIDSVAGQGTSSRPTNYSIKAKPIAGQSYFRLLQHDYDKTTQASPIIFLGNCGSEQAFTLFPNPSSNTIQFSIPLKQIEILDQNNRLVYSLPGLASTLSVQSLSSGIYVLKGNTQQGNQISRKLVVLH